MATKTLTITEEAYNILAGLKEGNESFSQVIVSKVGEKKRKSDYEKLKELSGIFKGKSGELLEKRIKEGRKVHRKMHAKRTERLLKQWEER